MKPEAILLTNSSAIDIDKIAGVTKRPEEVAGAHFFAPANVMKLLEVVEGPRTSPIVLAAAMKLGRTSARSAPMPAIATASSPIAAASPSTSKWSSCSRRARCPSRSTR